jgi:Tfp pilus assembly protein PilF
MLRLLPLLLLPLLPVPTALAQPRPPAEQQRAEMDRLFEALQSAPDQAGAHAVEMRIRALWQQAISPSAGLLVRRGLRNLQGEEPAEALDDFDAAITLEPRAAEAWLLRARAYMRLGDRPAAARDLQEALRLEPRHFGALAALSELQEEAGDAAGALRSMEAALVLHPRMPGGPERLRELRRRAEGDAL